MGTSTLVDIVIGSLVCGITKEDFSNCEYCPVRRLCDQALFEKTCKNPLNKEEVHHAVATLWGKDMLEKLKPILTYYEATEEKRK